jgi:21S rRNA (GM2251-2'-O)-methyltransferase
MQLWLALDGVTDPQNFGALLRTAAFLGADGVVVGQRHSAPLSGVVSKASAGAMEQQPVHAARSLAASLGQLRAKGWAVLGAALADNTNTTTHAPGTTQNQGDHHHRPHHHHHHHDHDKLNQQLQQQQPQPQSVDIRCYDADRQQQRHTVLVLGSEGEGLRDRVLAQCTVLVHVPSCAPARGNLDSLNVSVAGAILLHHLAGVLRSTDSKHAGAVFY